MELVDREVNEQFGQFNCPNCCSQQNITNDEKQSTNAVDNVVNGNIVSCHQCKMDFFKDVENCSLCEQRFSN
ncbi:hypothetical protein A9G24_04830 [Gilliamella sp. App6-5]|nr:hypothetical protein A9G24_04830 [Gilliamella apicola]